VFLIRLIMFPFRLAFGSARVGWRTGRLVGPSRALFFGLGVATGVLAASPAARRRALAGVATAVDAVRDRMGGEAGSAPAPITGPAQTPTVTVPEPVPSATGAEPAAAPTTPGPVPPATGVQPTVPDDPTGRVSPSD
jgi:hypothetical protein